MKQKCKGEGILEKERVTHAEHEADREMKRVSDSYGTSQSPEQRRQIVWWDIDAVDR